ncbi:MAG: 50S ribosomal protein L21 [Gammaproteobacteria bacterium]|nr:50S ribosomal protein L21 [Gammaproteobacteria bacterium]
MYAVVVSGGKQYRIAEGDTIKVEKITAEEGTSIELDKVLMISDADNISVGAPYLDDCKVTATIASHGRHKKIKIVKFRRRKHSRTQMGHRQWYTELKITGIAAS